MADERSGATMPYAKMVGSGKSRRTQFAAHQQPPVGLVEADPLSKLCQLIGQSLL